MIADVYLYNPTNEMAIANGNASYMPPLRLRQFEKDLCTLPMFFATESDIVLVDRQPPALFTELWQKAGKKLPSFVEEKNALNDSTFCQLPKGFLYPWGWSPAVHKRLEPFKESCSDEFKYSPVALWKENFREMYSRKTALAILTEVLKSIGETNWLIPVGEMPVLCSDWGGIDQLRRKWEKIVVKSPWSSSGRGIQMVGKSGFNQSNRQVVSGFLNQQGFVLVEPLHNKVADLSLHFYAGGESEITYRGQASFLTDSVGRYRGNYIGELPPGLSSEEEQFLKEHLPEVKNTLHRALTNSILSQEYRGWVGVDLLLYHDGYDNLRLHPCLEINSRFNMGALTLKLRELISPDSSGQWEIIHGKPGHFANEMAAKMSQFPVQMFDGKIAEGVLPMTPVREDAQFGAWLKVERI